MMDKLTQYLQLQNEIYAYFGYEEDWVVIPIDDRRKMYWQIIGGEGYGGVVSFGEAPDSLKTSGGRYEDVIYTQRHLPKWVYRAPEYTMICVDTHTDGNKFLAIFDNTKEVVESF